MTNKTKGKLIKGGALALDVGVPLAVTLSYFPLWVEKSAETTVSGIAVVFALLSIIPALRVLKNRVSSPAAWMVWTCLAGILIAINTIIDQAVVIAVFGAISNGAGAAVYKVGERIEKKE
ncbi:MAG: hypothetical protein IKB51_06870 [Clostridia bacterium]|nr:hypothetical protein [Clostridia bacterium]